MISSLSSAVHREHQVGEVAATNAVIAGHRLAGECGPADPCRPVAAPTDEVGFCFRLNALR